MLGRCPPFLWSRENRATEREEGRIREKAKERRRERKEGRGEEEEKERESREKRETKLLGIPCFFSQQRENQKDKKLKRKERKK